ncbi:MAG TPA: sugar ABC transporter substrate-binding protein [Chloroflexota bacterium]|nr:sugar ABC transporter substrate-binding protein [Chloroflexota bacterium]
MRDRAWGQVQRRRLLSVGGLGLAGAALAACGQQAGSAPGTGTARKGPVTIEVLTRSGVTSPTGHSQFYNTRAQQLFTPETNITVTFIDAQPDVAEKLTVMAAGGALPDGSWFGVVADGSAGREQATKGIFRPLDDLAKKDSKFDIKPYFKSMLDAFTVDGKLYALPTHAHYGTHVLYYNKNLTDAAGVKIPDDGNWTQEEFIEAAQKLTRRGEDVWGYWPSWGFSEFGVFWLRQFGAEFLDEPGKKLLMDTAEARAAFQWVYDSQVKFQVIDDLYRVVQGAPLGLGGNRGLFAMGRLAMHATTPGLVAEYKKPNTEEIKFEAGIALFPKGPGGRRGTQASGSGMGLTKTDKQDAVWEWLKFVTNKDNGVEQVFGGAGSPGGRTDVWNDAKLLKERDPIYSTIIKAFPQGAGSLRFPANFRYTELLRVVNTELDVFFKGQTSVSDALAKATQAGNVVLSQ